MTQVRSLAGTAIIWTIFKPYQKQTKLISKKYP